jgi:hypothetical protein
MPLEYQLNYDPSRLDGKITPIVTEKLGIRFPTSAQQNLSGAALRTPASTNQQTQAFREFAQSARTLKLTFKEYTMNDGIAPRYVKGRRSFRITTLSF